MQRDILGMLQSDVSMKAFERLAGYHDPVPNKAELFEGAWSRVGEAMQRHHDNYGVTIDYEPGNLNEVDYVMDTKKDRDRTKIGDLGLEQHFNFTLHEAVKNFKIGAAVLRKRLPQKPSSNLIQTRFDEVAHNREFLTLLLSGVDTNVRVLEALEQNGFLGRRRTETTKLGRAPFDWAFNRFRETIRQSHRDFTGQVALTRWEVFQTAFWMG